MPGVDPLVQGEASQPLDAPAGVLGAMGSSSVSSHPSAIGVWLGVTRMPRPRPFVGDERMLKENITSYILEHSKRYSFVVAEHPVGLDEILQDFERSVKISKDVKIVGITGMGGSGKTTLAKHYYNKKKQSFYKYSFVSLQDTSNKNLYKKQEKMFGDIVGPEYTSLASMEEGKAILAEYLSSVQIFIILDDVNDLKQLDSLLPVKDNLNQNSIIVITSRDSGILTSWGIPSDCIYKMKGLNTEHAMELFCWNALGQLSPINEFEYLVQKFLEVCQGLPLSLKVLGRLVRGESKEFWDDQLNQLSRILPEEIESVLKVSFDALNKEAQEVFLDISCFFTGTETETDSVITLWDGSGWSGLCSLKKLVNKCLVDVNESKCIRMHDQLRDLGRQIAETRPPYRLWSRKQIDHIEEQGEQIVLIRGIKAETDEFYEDAMNLVRGSNISKRRLEILDVKNNYFTEELATVAEPLIWLRWGNFPHTALPSWIPMKKLRVLELRKASKLEELWSEEADPPVQLIVLKIIHTGSFLRFPRSIRFLKDLKKISLHSDGAPIEGLPEEFCLLQSLECLELGGCRKLKSLPSKFGNLTNLRRLVLEGCSGIEVLPDGFCRLQSLEFLNINVCHKLKALPSKFGNLTNLRELRMHYCKEIEVLPAEFGRLQSLNLLDLNGCHKLRSLPCKLSDLSNLKRLNLGRCSGIEGLPEEFGQLQSLKSLNLSGCHKLRSLPSKFGDLTSLEYLILQGCSGIEGLPEEFGHLQSLKSLHLSGCHTLKTLPSKFGDLTSLEYLILQGCSGIEGLPEEFGHLQSLKSLHLSGCHTLKSLPSKFGDLTSLEYLILEGCSGIEGLPEEFGHLQSLKSLHLSGCHTLKSLPSKFGDLTSLEYLILEGCSGIEGLPEEFGHLQSLKSLHLSGCHTLKSLPSKFGDLTSLEYLILEGCSGIEGLPEDFGHLQSLKSLDLSGCHTLKSLPGKFGDLTKLRTLKLWKCNGLMIPTETLAQLTSLGLLKLSGCLEHTELVIQPGCFSSFSSLTSMAVGYCPVSRISISQQCCPSLETLHLSHNQDLVEMDCLPTSVSYIYLDRCPKLESISLNSCGPVQTSSINECGKLRKIKGLQNCRRLQISNGEACSKVPVLECLKGMESLQSVSLTAACDISAFEAFLQTLNREKWPKECVISCRTAPGVEAIIKSLAFPALTSVDSFDRQRTSRRFWRYKFVKERSTNEAEMICLVIDSPSNAIDLYLDDMPGRVRVNEGKWVYIVVFTGSVPVRTKVSFCLYSTRREGEGPIEVDCVEMGVLAMGEEKRVVDAFFEVVQLLGKVCHICCEGR
ncbi:hypothetical protein SUGI_0172340 [Cryptomeria japonica]|nr:hypothetical protein SUGI_0172340 [Cryptomeria japonica]